jgi:quinolinate synthase
MNLDIVERINTIKKEKSILILSHYYMEEDLQFSVEEGGFVDFVGDSLGLSLEASKAKADHIVFCGVRFMAETALLVNEAKRVFMLDISAGCSLASSITAAEIRKLKLSFPNVPIMGYINTYAETKTELDICCTSRNAIKVAASLDSDTILFVPDYYMGQNLQKVIHKELGKELILWKGACSLHEQFRDHLRTDFEIQDDTEFLFHWEVPADTINDVLHKRPGMIGSTKEILDYAKNSKSHTFYLASECDLGVKLKKENKDKVFITPCLNCNYMKQNSLAGLLEVLEAIGSSREIAYEVTIEEEIKVKAKVPVLRMLAV